MITCHSDQIMTQFKKDYGLETLLLLDGEIFPMDNGYWTKFEARKVIPSKNVPHGIKYSLTLHDKNNQRVIGFDNAHGIKSKKNKYIGKRTIWDHKHKMDIIEPYEFDNPGQLLEDFWNDVNRQIESKR